MAGTGGTSSLALKGALPRFGCDCFFFSHPVPGRDGGRSIAFSAPLDKADLDFLSRRTGIVGILNGIGLNPSSFGSRDT